MQLSKQQQKKKNTNKRYIIISLSSEVYEYISHTHISYTEHTRSDMVDSLAEVIHT